MSAPIGGRKNGRAAGDIVFPAVFPYWPMFVLLMGLIAAQPARADVRCATDPERLGAHYEHRIEDLASGESRRDTLELWRDGRRVLHVHPERAQAELWERGGDGRLHLVVWYDQHARGIEYLPEDLGPAAGAGEWEAKWRLIPQASLRRLGSGKVQGLGCERRRVWTQEAGGRRIELVWDEYLQLPRRYVVTRGKRRETWVLREVVGEPARVAAAFSRRDAYRTTDYVDIGDDESDPFIRRMIHLGFLPHGASGFYDADGHALEGHRH